MFVKLLSDRTTLLTIDFATDFLLEFFHEKGCYSKIQGKFIILVVRHHFPMRWVRKISPRKTREMFRFLANDVVKHLPLIRFLEKKIVWTTSFRFINLDKLLAVYCIQSWNSFSRKMLYRKRVNKILIRHKFDMTEFEQSIVTTGILTISCINSNDRFGFNGIFFFRKICEFFGIL